MDDGFGKVVDCTPSVCINTYFYSFCFYGCLILFIGFFAALSWISITHFIAKYRKINETELFDGRMHTPCSRTGHALMVMGVMSLCLLPKNDINFCFCCEPYRHWTAFIQHISLHKSIIMLCRHVPRTYHDEKSSYFYI